MQPELFAGTIQHNLDPFGYHDTPELEAALLSAQGLESTSVDGDRMELGKRIAGNGDLSAGERQIVALARAIVRKSRLLIMDEGVYLHDRHPQPLFLTSHPFVFILALAATSSIGGYSETVCALCSLLIGLDQTMSATRGSSVPCGTT